MPFNIYVSYSVESVGKKGKVRTEYREQLFLTDIPTNFLAQRICARLHDVFNVDVWSQKDVEHTGKAKGKRKHASLDL